MVCMRPMELYDFEHVDRLVSVKFERSGNGRVDYSVQVLCDGIC